MHLALRLLMASVGLALAAGTAAAAPRAPIQVDGHQPVFPENITATSDGTLYTSSVGLGRVFRAPPGAKEATAWSETPSSGPKSILGVYAEERTGTLWACYSDMAWSKGKTGEPAILRALSLSTGKVQHSYPMPAGSFCNDITFDKQGTIYATDTHGGRIMRLTPGATTLTTWFQDKRLAGVDGITFGQDGMLYLTNVKTNKLFRLTLASDGMAGTLIELALSRPVKHPDGLRPGENGALYLAENAGGTVDLLHIQGKKVAIETVHGGYNGPTSMVPHGDTLYIVEAKIGEYGKKANPSPFYIYPVPIPPS